MNPGFKNSRLAGRISVLRQSIRRQFPGIPLLGWLFGALTAVLAEKLLGTPLALSLGLPKIPVLFGFVIMLKRPVLIPSAIIYILLVYALPLL